MGVELNLPRHMGKQSFLGPNWLLGEMASQKWFNEKFAPQLNKRKHYLSPNLMG